MAEVAFARSFLSALDARPIKISPDHVEDPKNFPARSAQILPKMPKAMSKPHRTAPPGSLPTVSVHLKSLKNPPISHRLGAQPLSTSMLDLKQGLAAETGIPVAKIKLLHEKKPVADSKVLKDLVGEQPAAGTSVELAVMVLGGAAVVARPAEKEAAGGPTGAEGVAGVETQEFWDDLKGYLMQRLKDEKQAGELQALFKASWEARK